VNILLRAIDRAGKDIDYYAVDLSLPELERTFGEIPTIGYKHVKCFGLYGTYDHALEWLSSSEIRDRPKTILWLGSSLGNYTRPEAGNFLAKYRDALQPGDNMLIGIDSCKDSARVYHAYNDKEGVTHEFILNGLKNANTLLDQGTGFDLNDWRVIGEYDTGNGRHHAFVSPIKDVMVDNVLIRKDERVRIEESYKYSHDEILRLWEDARLSANTVWSNKRGDYALHLVSKSGFFFPSRPAEYASHPEPTEADWEELWKSWDMVSRGMVPNEELSSKPIKLRNAIIFYLGHIPTFLDIHIARATDGQPTEPAYFWKIFERGIDPDVDNPEQCHAHSEIPDSWPPVDEILTFQNDVRTKVKDLYASGSVASSRRVAKAMWIGFEHEAMHLETLLYMLVQSEKILPPPRTAIPDFEALARLSGTKAVENEWFRIPEMDIDIGHDDPDDPSGPARYFGWDIEKPRRSLHVPSFKAKARPITNGEYANYLYETGKSTLPASWCLDPYSTGGVTQKAKRDSVMNGTNGHSNGSINSFKESLYVRTVYGSVPLKFALDWPILASYNELTDCASWMGGSIPTMEQVYSIYRYAESSRAKVLENALGKTIPAVNG
jgi:EasF-like predicted methyltransferase